MGTIQFKQVNCKNCYKCIRNCPVKAISLIDDHAQVIEDGCVLCGKCLHVCPQNAKSVRTDVQKVKEFIKKKQKVYASIAPSFPAAYNTIDKVAIVKMFEKLGFTYVEETAYGASLVTDIYRKLIQEKQMRNIICTACPSVVSLVEKHYPQLVDQLAPVVSPMIAHGKMLKELYGQRIKVVFVGPCLSKKKEFLDSQNDKVIDAVITFDELEDWMKAEGLSFPEFIASEKEIPEENMSSMHLRSTYPGVVSQSMGTINLNSRFYPAPGGIIKAIGSFKKLKYKPLKFDGTERCMEVLESLVEGNISGYFIEMNSCAGGCLGGPCMNIERPNYIETREKLLGYITEQNKEYEGNPGMCFEHRMHTIQDYSKTFSDKSSKFENPVEGEILTVLATIGKYSKEDELNCGACGYTTCREKAVAVLHGKAESRMCVPFMRQRAESLSNVIIQTTPNAIFALSEELDIQEANQAACKLFGLDGDEYKGRKIYEILECPEIYNVRDTGQEVLGEKFSYENYGIVVEQSILYVKENHMIIIIMKDITIDEKKQLKMNKVKTETVEIAQKVIEKQMRVAQEIASLLGETTAETKVALTKLKNAIQSEMGDDR